MGANPLQRFELVMVKLN